MGSAATVAAMIALLAWSAWHRSDASSTGEGQAWAATPPARPQLGMNLSAVVDWSREWTFVDAFKHSRAWIPQRAEEGGPWDTGEKLALTAEGWPLLKPGQAASTLMFREIGGHYPAGTYTCTFDGHGEIRFGFDAKRSRTLGPGRMAVEVEPGDGGIFLRIVESDPKDPIRNIRLWLPGFENAKSSFHPLYVKRLRPFKVIRFMDWQCTNNSTLARWADRTTPSSARQSLPAGVALEYMIELANELGADPWFCMPHLADDDFVRHFATMVRDRLHPDATIYVEWSNEAWNGIFGQAHWVYDEAKKRGEPGASVIADEARRDWKIWQDVFGDRHSRIVRVAAGQHYNPEVAARILDRLDGDCDAIACAAYFGPREGAKFDEHTTGRDVVVSSLANIQEKCLPMIEEHRKLAARWSAKTGRRIRLLTYEAGQHILPIGGFGGGQQGFVPWKQATWDCQTDPLMYDAYTALLRGCQDAGVEVVTAFSYVGQQTKWGSWGHLQYQDEPLESAPKFRALVEFAATQPARN